eukprot:6468811-Amphidinium_carterae.1
MTTPPGDSTLKSVLKGIQSTTHNQGVSALIVRLDITNPASIYRPMLPSSSAKHKGACTLPRALLQRAVGLKKGAAC